QRRRRGEPPDAEEGRTADPRRADQGAQEGRSQEGPQGPAVQQALIPSANMGRIFGTDGVRGLANRDLTAELAVDLSVAAAHVLGEAGVFADQRPTAVVARDTRASGEFLEAAVVAGLASAG